MIGQFEIVRLGAQGDGVADTPNGPVFIPYALPGEAVSAERKKDRADLISIEKTAPQRIDPACRHFGSCGGCAVQHLEEKSYRDWKRDKVVQALRGLQIETGVGEIIPCAPHTRRRAALSACKGDGGMLLGYHRHLSSDIVDIVECPVSLPEIVAAFDDLRTLAAMIATTGQSFRMLVTATDWGLDIAAHDSGKLGESRRHAASEFVIRHGFARLSIDGEIIVEPKKPTILFGAASVEIPSGSFLQATAFAEQAMADIVGAHLSRAKKIADLFSGSGSFALRLAKKSEIHAVDGEGASIAALDRASRFTPGLKRVTVEKRDLFRRPLTFKELNAFDGLVFDPPRAGAEDQSKQIARSDVPYVAAVSCNPTTLARDLSIFAAGGYRIRSVTPVDQFLWSPHVEAVVLLEKPKKRR